MHALDACASGGGSGRPDDGQRVHACPRGRSLVVAAACRYVALVRRASARDAALESSGRASKRPPRPPRCARRRRLRTGHRAADATTQAATPRPTPGRSRRRSGNPVAPRLDRIDSGRVPGTARRVLVGRRVGSATVAAHIAGGDLPVHSADLAAVHRGVRPGRHSSLLAGRAWVRGRPARSR